MRRDTPKSRAFLERGRRSSAESLRASGRQRPPKSTELTLLEARLQQAFKLAAHQQGECQSCGYRGVFLEAHHSIAKALLKRLLGKRGEPCTPEVLWDTRNALLLCAEPAPNRCHNRHTLAFRRVRRSALRPENWAFARDLDLEWVLETEYPA